MTKKKARVIAFLKRPEAAGMRQADIAKRLGVSTGMVSRISTEDMGLRRYTGKPKAYSPVMERAKAALQDETLMFMSMAELGRRVQVSPCTIQRAAAELGLRDHPFAKRYLRSEPTDAHWHVVREWLAQKTTAEIADASGMSRALVYHHLCEGMKRLGLKKAIVQVAYPAGEDVDCSRGRSKPQKAKKKK